MPTRAQRICKYPGCNKVIPYGGSAYCETHKETYFNNRAKLSKSYDVMRPERHKFYHTARWRRVREAYIKKNPLCARNEMRWSSATQAGGSNTQSSI